MIYTWQKMPMYMTPWRNKMSISKREIRLIVEKSSCGRRRVREMDDSAPQIGTSYEDVRELAKYHALNGDRDEMLYRDNPDYKEAYDSMQMKENKMHLRTKIRRLTESMKNLYGDIQNEILFIGREQGGELVVQDVVDYLQNYANDPLGDNRASYVSSMPYEEVQQIMFDMVNAGMLTDGYEDFFYVHPDYM